MNINIVQLDRSAENFGIITVHWTASKTDGEYTAAGSGAQGFAPDPDSPDYVPFDEFTEADAIEWLTAKTGWLEDLEARLDAVIESQKTPGGDA